MIAIEKPKLPTLPKLNYGEGTFAYTDNGAIAYKKYIRLSDGSTIRKTVNSPTVIGCIERMHKVEEDIKRTGCHKGPSDTLKTELNYWLMNVKKNQVKTQSYNRLETTIRTIINPWGTVNKKAFLVRPQELQEFINGMNDGDHSHSTIKKVFDCLNDFFRYISLRDGTANPMLTVCSISKHNVQKKEKKAHYLDKENIEKFKSEAVRTWSSTGKPRYRYGLVFIANLYLGLRIGELMALKWRDVHFDENYIDVNKTIVQERITNNPSKGKKEYEKSNVFVIQDSTKTNKNRKVPMNRTARKYLKLHLERTDFKNPDDYVVATKTGGNCNTKNMQSSLALIIKNAHIMVEATNTHIMRHTCATLLYNNGVDLHSISKILGNSEEVLKKTYVHFEEDRLSSIMEMIDDIE